MKLIKEIVVSYNEFKSSKMLSSVNEFLEAERLKSERPNLLCETPPEPFNLFFEVREDAESVIFAILYQFEGDFTVQVETGVLDKETKEMVYVIDNKGLDDYDELSKYPYWERSDLEAIGVHGFRSERNGEFDHSKSWDY